MNVLLALLLVTSQIGATATPGQVGGAVEIVDGLVDALQDLADTVQRSTSGAGGSPSQETIDDVYSEEQRESDEAVKTLESRVNNESWDLPDDLQEFERIQLNVTKHDVTIASYQVVVSNGTVSAEEGVWDDPDGWVEIDHESLVQTEEVSQDVRETDSTLRDHRAELVEIYFGIEMSPELAEAVSLYNPTELLVAGVATASGSSERFALAVGGESDDDLPFVLVLLPGSLVVGFWIWRRRTSENLEWV